MSFVEHAGQGRVGQDLADHEPAGADQRRGQRLEQRRPGAESHEGGRDQQERGDQRRAPAGRVTRPVTIAPITPPTPYAPMSRP